MSTKIKNKGYTEALFQMLKERGTVNFNELIQPMRQLFPEKDWAPRDVSTLLGNMVRSNKWPVTRVGSVRSGVYAIVGGVGKRSRKSVETEEQAGVESRETPDGYRRSSNEFEVDLYCTVALFMYLYGDKEEEPPEDAKTVVELMRQHVMETHPSIYNNGASSVATLFDAITNASSLFFNMALQLKESSQ